MAAAGITSSHIVGDGTGKHRQSDTGDDYVSVGEKQNEDVHDDDEVEVSAFGKEVYSGYGGMKTVIGALIFVQCINSGYNILTKARLGRSALHPESCFQQVAVSKGGANPLVFSLFRDALAYPILQVLLPSVFGPMCEYMPCVFMGNGHKHTLCRVLTMA